MNQHPPFRHRFIPSIGAILFGFLFAGTIYAQVQVTTYNGAAVVADEILIRLRAPDATALARVRNVLPQANIGLINEQLSQHVVRAPGQSLPALLQAFSNQPDVLYAEPNYIVSAVVTPNDPLFSSLWGMTRIGAPAAWNVTTGGTSSVIGVVDTGVNYNHPDLAANIWSAPTAYSVTIGSSIVNCPAGSHGFNAITMSCDPLDDNDHGTHVSGTIAATGNNGTGVVGVNWTARILGLKFLDSAGNGFTSDAIKAIEFARQVKLAFAGTSTPVNVRVLSNSWSGGGYSQSLLDEINLANSDNMLFVAAAGNNSSNNDIVATYPANYSAPNVISVAATTSADLLAGFSNYGATKVHLGAPGQSINSTVRSGYSYFSGTSMATPHVAGAALLTLSACPSLSTAALKNAILNNVAPLPSLQGYTITGGILDVDKAVRSCQPQDTTPPVLSNGAPSGTLAAGTTQTTLSLTSDENAVCRYSTVAGTPYAAMTNTFASTGTTSHSTPVSGLSNGNAYSFFTRCQDGSGNANTSDYTIAFSVGSGSPPPDILTGLQGYWAFNETSGNTASDSSGNNNSGLLTNGPAWNSSGKIGGALLFDGINDYVSLGDPVSLRPSNFITMAAWANFNDVSGTSAILAKDDSKVPLNATFLRMQAGYVVCSIGGTRIFVASGVATGQWVHLACTYDGSNIRVYIDGIQQGVLARTGTIPDESGVGWLIGARTPAGPATFMNGLLDDVRLYDRALSAVDITGLQNPTTPPDTVPPVLSNGAPSGTLAAGTTQTTLSLTSDENAVCRYSTVAGTPYAAMTNTFASTGTTSHSTPVSGLSNGNAYSFFTRCQDGSGNANTSDYTIAFSVAQPADTTPPVLSNGAPSGTLAAGTTQTTLSLTSDENAVCRYSTVAGTPYAAMTNTFASTGTTSHSTPVSGLSNGNAYSFFTRCQDGSGNANTSDYTIAFSVGSGSPPPDILTGLQGYWAFNETSGNTASDSSGNNNSGLLTNGPAWNSSGKIGGALLFDGINDYVSLGDPVSLRPSNFITMAAWANFNDVSGTSAILAKDDSKVPLNATFLRMQAGYVVCSIGGTRIFVASGVATGQWVHLACTYDGSNIRVYIDGIQQGVLTRTGTIPDESGVGWLIGARTPAGPATFMNGLLDDVRLYDRALSAVDITGLQNPTTPPDTVPPVLSNGAPSGTLAAGTTQTTLSLTSDENAVCRYSTVAGTPYAAMTNTFASTGTTSHSTPVSGLSNGNAYSFFTRCQDGSGNANTSDYTIAFSVAQPADTTPPVLSNGAPSGTLAAGTTQTTLSLTSDENAVCRYSTVAGTPYAAMTNTFASTGTTSHSTPVSGLSNGNAYSFFTRCQDGSGNANTSDYTIAFSVGSGSPPPDILTGLQGYWAFNETSGNTASDSSGNNNSGLLTNGPAWNSSGKIGGALLFDGINDYVSLGDPVSLRPSNFITMAAWANFNDVSGTSAILAKDDSKVPLNATFLRMQAGYVVCSIGGTRIFVASGVATGQWVHLACTYDGSNIRVYIDGIQQGVLARTGTIPDESGVGWLIGARTPAGPATFMNGLLDDVRLYDRALSAVDITGLQNPTTPPDTVPPVLSNGAPSGTLAAGTTQTTLSLTSDENAVCRYSTVAGTPYAAMTNTFASTGTTSHSTPVSGLSNGNAYSFFTRCQDGSGNANTSDYTIAFSVGSGSPPPDILTGLQGYWAFNETSGNTASDSSGNNNSGLLTNGPAWNSSGKIGGALLFDGINDYVSLGDPVSLRPSNFITMAAWANFNDVSGTSAILAKDDSKVPLNATFLRMQAGYVVCSIGGTRIFVASGVATGQWVHLACTYDGSNIRVYIDGIQQGVLARTGTIPDESGVGWLIGARTPAGPATFMNGLLDDVRLYDRALSAVDITGLHNFQ